MAGHPGLVQLGVSGRINISAFWGFRLCAVDLLPCLVKPSEASPTLCIPSLRKLVMSAFGGFGRCTAGSYNVSGSINFLWLPCKSLGPTQSPQVELTQVTASETLQALENVIPRLVLYLNTKKRIEKICRTCLKALINQPNE